MLAVILTVFMIKDKILTREAENKMPAYISRSPRVVREDVL